MLTGGGERPGPLVALAQTILLALLTALAVSVVLVGTTLFFASRAIAAPPPAVERAGQGALMLRADGTEVPAPALSTEVTIRVTGLIVRVHVRQTFASPFDRWLEGVYVFPLPEGAAVDGYRMRIGERVVVAELREREAAKRSYDAARDQGRRAVLLEQERPNIFTASVANIAPREAIVVEIDYQDVAQWDRGTFSLRFPMVVGPRYVPGPLLGTGDATGSGTAPATSRVPDAHRITPPVVRPERVPEGLLPNPVTIRVELDAGVPLEAVTSPSHEVRATRHEGGRYEVRFAAERVPADRDFELRWTPVPQQAPQAALLAERGADGAYALLMLLPPGQGASDRARLPRESIFVIDTSGSMHGASIAQARAALQLALARLRPEDRFNVIEFNSRTRMLFDTPRGASAANLGRATQWVARLEAQGGTEMAAALLAALDARQHPGVVRQVVFLTDGAVGNEEELFGIIAARLGDSRLFTVGIGSAPNGRFMTRAARLGRGTFTFIGDVAEVGERTAALFAKLDAPVLKDVVIEWPGPDAEVWPARVPDLYAGEPVVVAARVARLEGTVRVRGEQNGLAWTSEVPLAQATEGTGIGKRWARGKIDALDDAEREARTPDAKRGEIVAVALAHGLATRHTSFVAVDRAPVRPPQAALTSSTVPTNLPAGWDADRTLGIDQMLQATIAIDVSGPTLPQTATPATLRVLLGLTAIAIALLLLSATRRRVA
jgi:Ca-activated chloride channel family protein